MLSYRMRQTVPETHVTLILATRSCAMYRLARSTAAQSPAGLVMGWQISCGPTSREFQPNSVALDSYGSTAFSAHKPGPGRLSTGDVDGSARSQTTESQLATPVAHGWFFRVVENSLAMDFKAQFDLLRFGKYRKNDRLTNALNTREYWLVGHTVFSGRKHTKLQIVCFSWLSTVLFHNTCLGAQNQTVDSQAHSLCICGTEML